MHFHHPWLNHMLTWSMVMHDLQLLIKMGLKSLGSTIEEFSVRYIMVHQSKCVKCHSVESVPCIVCMGSILFSSRPPKMVLAKSFLCNAVCCLHPSQQPYCQLIHISNTSQISFVEHTCSWFLSFLWFRQHLEYRASSDLVWHRFVSKNKMPLTWPNDFGVGGAAGDAVGKWHAVELGRWICAAAGTTEVIGWVPWNLCRWQMVPLALQLFYALHGACCKSWLVSSATTKKAKMHEGPLATLWFG
jgi:hypothetical protein